MEIIERQLSALLKITIRRFIEKEMQIKMKRRVSGHAGSDTAHRKTVPISLDKVDWEGKTNGSVLSGSSMQALCDGFGHYYADDYDV